MNKAKMMRNCFSVILLSTITITSNAGAFEVENTAGDNPSSVTGSGLNDDGSVLLLDDDIPPDQAAASPVARLPSTRTPASPTSPETDIATMERSVLQQINSYRVYQGLPQLALNTTISEQARIHSRNMASGIVPLGHTGFETRIQAIAQTIPYKNISENIAINQGYSNPATTAVMGWLKSPRHLANIVGNYRLTGIGVAKNSAGKVYFTQIFLN